MAYKHIGVAISGNEEDALLVNKALELARHNDAPLTLIHIDDGLRVVSGYLLPCNRRYSSIVEE